MWLVFWDYFEYLSLEKRLKEYYKEQADAPIGKSYF